VGKQIEGRRSEVQRGLELSKEPLSRRRSDGREKVRFGDEVEGHSRKLGLS
jgi:hypothetical protein